MTATAAEDLTSEVAKFPAITFVAVDQLFLSEWSESTLDK
jgi:hypothetical protein